MRRLTVVVYFAVVLIPVVLLGHDGPWLGAGDFDIRGKAPFPKKFTPGTFRDFDEWFADHLGLRYPLIYAGTGLHIGLLRRRSGESTRISAPSGTGLPNAGYRFSSMSCRTSRASTENTSSAVQSPSRSPASTP